MSSRQYTKRIWRVPKDRGALEFFATLLCKALVKHGWPASFKRVDMSSDEFVVTYDHPNKIPPGPDFFRAVEIATRVVARTYKVDVLERDGFVAFQRNYDVSPRGQFIERK